MTEAEARQQLVELVKKDIASAGWRIISTHVSRKKSTYLRCRKDTMRLTVRISNHPPKNSVGCTIHPGGHTRDDLLKKLQRKPPPSMKHFAEWLNS